MWLYGVGQLQEPGFVWVELLQAVALHNCVGVVVKRERLMQCFGPQSVGPSGLDFDKHNRFAGKGFGRIEDRRPCRD